MLSPFRARLMCHTGFADKVYRVNGFQYGYARRETPASPRA